MSVAESTSQQSDVLWRNKRKRSGSNNSSNNDEPIISSASYVKHSATSPAPRHWASAPKQRSNSVHRYITLAAESPTRPSADEEDSEDSLFGSFHERETDICRDTSDTDSYDTDGFATLDVIEYEVPSGSSSNSDLYSHDSSSGTDDFVVTAAQLARAIFTNSVGGDSSADGPFEVLADTEESDGPEIDPELGLADYWMCFKCRNRQNNPMYPFCERCFTTRKKHYPARPKPKLRKTRSSPAKLQPSFRSRSAALRHATSQQINAASSSFDSDTDNDPALEGSTSPHLNRRNANRTYPPRKPTTTNMKNRNVQNSKANSAGESGPASQSDVAVDSEEFEPGQPSCPEERLKLCPIQNKFLTNVCADAPVINRAPPDNLSIATTRDSGFQSSCGSSADMSPDVAPLGLARSSQETYCSDLEDSSLLSSGTPLASTVGSTSNVSNASTASSSVTASQVVQSVSSCSTQNSSDLRTNRKRSYSDTESGSSLEQKKSRVQEDEDLDLTASTIVPATPEGAASTGAAGPDIDSSYGLCMMCLTEPKNGVFVHSRFLHLCCCYRCAVKVWKKQKRCPICNCKVKNVLKLFVH